MFKNTVATHPYLFLSRTIQLPRVHAKWWVISKLRSRDLMTPLWQVNTSKHLQKYLILLSLLRQQLLMLLHIILTSEPTHPPIRFHGCLQQDRTFQRSSSITVQSLYVFALQLRPRLTVRHKPNKHRSFKRQDSKSKTCWSVECSPSVFFLHDLI